MKTVTSILFSLAALALVSARSADPALSGNSKSCNEGNFQCDDGLCIPGSFVCDNIYDCTTGNDETDCGSGAGMPEAAPRRAPSTSCNPGMYQCDDSLCIPDTFVCDGVYDCTTGDDEYDCGSGAGMPEAAPRRAPSTSCNPGMYQCDDSLCIPDTFVCDGVYDCTTGDDETDCGSGCPTGYYECDGGECIALDFVCDGEEQCPSGSDEALCGTDQW